MRAGGARPPEPRPRRASQAIATHGVERLSQMLHSTGKPGRRQDRGTAMGRRASQQPRPHRRCSPTQSRTRARPPVAVRTRSAAAGARNAARGRAVRRSRRVPRAPPPTPDRRRDRPPLAGRASAVTKSRRARTDEQQQHPSVKEYSRAPEAPRHVRGRPSGSSASLDVGERLEGHGLAMDAEQARLRGEHLDPDPVEDLLRRQVLPAVAGRRVGPLDEAHLDQQQGAPTPGSYSRGVDEAARDDEPGGGTRPDPGAR